MTADPERIAFLANAYRARHHSRFAAIVVRDRHLDFTAEECRLALAEVRTEAEAELIVAKACRAFLDDVGDR